MAIVLRQPLPKPLHWHPVRPFSGMAMPLLPACPRLATPHLFSSRHRSFLRGRLRRPRPRPPSSRRHRSLPRCVYLLRHQGPLHEHPWRALAMTRNASSSCSILHFLHGQQLNLMLSFRRRPRTFSTLHVRPRTTSSRALAKYPKHGAATPSHESFHILHMCQHGFLHISSFSSSRNS